MSSSIKATRRASSVKIIHPELVNLRVALDHAAAGIPVFPAELKLGEDGNCSKTPLVKWQRDATTDTNQIRKWWRDWPDAAVGIPLGICNLIAIDSVRHGGPDGVTALEQLVTLHKPLPPHPITLTAGNGEHHIFGQTGDRKLGNSRGRLPDGIDVRGDGGWIVAPGTVRPDGNRWQPADGAPSLIEAFRAGTIPRLPRWLADIIATRPTASAATNSKPRPPTEYEKQFATKMLENFAAELAQTEPGDGRNNKLNTLAYRMGRMGGAGWINEDEVRAALTAACNVNGLSSDKDSGGERGVRATFRSGWNAGLLKPRAPLKEAPFNSEEFLALEYVERYGDDLRYVAKSNRWMVWGNMRWQEDVKRVCFRNAREITREFANKAEKGGRGIATAKTRAAVVSLAQDDSDITAIVDQWDANLWLLNTPTGTIDLRNGKPREHRRDDYITKIAAVGPDPNCQTPIWEAFLKRTTAGDDELVGYLQRMTGYMLTGVTREHALFFLYGTGANGKSVFVNTITGILTDYHRVVPMDALLTTYNTQHTTDIAGLVGARIASAVEVAEGRTWDEPKIKLLTGGDKITARLMRQDNLDFVPQFKLLICGNHKPELRSVDEAMCRRFHMVPFTVTIPEDERDQKLTEKIKAEWPGILQWMIGGCLEWQSRGLEPPEAVINATEEYMNSQDVMSEFLEEYFIIEKGATVASSGVWLHYKEFQEARCGKPGHQQRFNAKMEQRGFTRDRLETGWVFRGLRLKENTTPEGVKLGPNGKPDY